MVVHLDVGNKGKEYQQFRFVLFFELTSLIRRQRNPSINSVFSYKSLQALGGGTQRIFKRIFVMIFDIGTNNSATFFDIRTNNSATRCIFKLILVIRSNNNNFIPDNEPIKYLNYLDSHDEDPITTNKTIGKAPLSTC